MSVDGVPLALELAAATTRLLSLGPDELNFIARLDPEHANLRAALRWAVSYEQTESALYAATALFQFWERRGHFQEGSGWLEAALARADASNVPAALRAAALNALAFLYWRGGAADRAEPVAREALAISRAARCAPELAHSLLNLGMTAFLHHQFVRAEACLEESIGYARDAGRTTVHSVALAFLGRVLLMSTEAVPDRAVEVIRQSLALARSGQSRYASAHALSTWGDLLWAQDNCAGAPRLEGRADRCFGSGGCTRCCWSPGAHGGCARALFTREEATWVFGAADALHSAIGMQLRRGDGVDLAHYAQFEQQQALRQKFPSAWLAGHAATSREAVARAIQYTQAM